MREAVAQSFGAEPVDFRQNALEIHVGGFAVAAFQTQGVGARIVAVQKDFAGLGRKVAPRGVGVEGDLFGELAQYSVVRDYYAFRAESPSLYRAAADAFRVVGDGESFVCAHDFADAAAIFAGAVGVVEGKISYGERLVDFAAFFAGKGRA